MNIDVAATKTSKTASRLSSCLRPRFWLPFSAASLAFLSFTHTAKAEIDWRRVAWCETHSRWTMRGPVYSGGLGFYNPTWRLWAGVLGLSRRYPNAADAPPAVQIRVAKYGHRHGGYRGSIANRWGA
jgi:hypothetical protein